MPPRPDVYAIVDRLEGSATLQIELTEYNVDGDDGQSGGSPGMRKEMLWQAVQSSVFRRLLRRPLAVNVHVRLREPIRLDTRLARPFAEELVRFVSAYHFSSSETETATRFGPKCRLLSEHVQWLRIVKTSGPRFWWSCSNTSAAAVGLKPHYVAQLVKGKTNYEWSGQAQKWLLICASGRAIVGTAGPRPFDDAWQKKVELACAASPFDQIYFWDRSHSWYERLK